ncbi:MAG: zinc carboxypeptidase [Oligoflexia bacterium]|nr:zinc carboxypeptidase [Oligoflexia bacterium]
MHRKHLLKKILLTLAIIFSTTSSFAGDSYHFVHLKAQNVEERSAIANHIPIDQIIDDSIYSVVSDYDYKIIQKNFPHFLVASHIYQIPSATTNENDDEFPSNDTAYHTYKETITELNQYQQKYPQISEIFSIGKSLEGKDLLGIHITAHANKVALKQNPDLFIPGIVIVALHHSREHLTTELALKYVDHLLSNYGKDATITSLINTRNIYIIPMLNPDGGMYDIKNRSYQYWRKNRRPNSNGSFGVDLNRNYGYQWGTGGSSNSPNSDVYMGPTPFSEPETIAFKDFITATPNIRILLTLHTYSELILYPWGHKYSGVGGKDEEVFAKMGQTIAAWNNYTPQRSSDLYIASGDTCDWAYGERGIFCFTFELSPKSGWFGGGFYPGTKAIEPTFQANIKPALYLIDLADSPYRALE